MNQEVAGPLVTVIIANRNSGESLVRTLASLERQTFRDFEVVAIDGASTDASLEILISHRSKFAHFVSEKDLGIADAWNKGLMVAKGRVIGLLNAGDEYHCETLQRAVKVFGERPEAISYGDCFLTDKGNVTRALIGDMKTKFVRGFGFAHTTCFVPRSVYSQVGNFDTSIRIALDTDFLVRAHKHGVPFVHGGQKVYMAEGGVSDRRFRRAFFEYLEVLEKHEAAPHLALRVTKLVFGVSSPLRGALKLIRRSHFLRQAKHFLNWSVWRLYSLLPLRFLRHAYLRLCGIRLGSKAAIIAPVRAYGFGSLSIGDGSVVNRGCLLDNRGAIEIGTHVSIAHDVRIYTTGHEVNSPYFEVKTRPVRIEDHVVLFGAAIVQPGVTIGMGSVVLPGAVVTKDVEPYTIVGGNPATKVGERNRDLCYTLEYDFWLAQ